MSTQKSPDSLDSPEWLQLAQLGDFAEEDKALGEKQYKVKSFKSFVDKFLNS